jgi:hypothetical protein
MERTMLNESKLLDKFWREAINTPFYILNRRKFKVNKNKTPYELWKGRPTTIKYCWIVCVVDVNNVGGVCLTDYLTVSLMTTTISSHIVMELMLTG